MEAKFPSKKRIERDGVLIHAEGDDLIDDPDEAARQGYTPDDAKTVTVTERIERDGVLVATEGDELTVDQAKELGITPAKAAPKRARKAAK